MKMNYEETVAVLSWGFFLDESPQKEKFNSVYGDNAFDKMKEFENEQFTTIMKRGSVEHIIDALNKSLDPNDYVKNIQKEISKSFERADVNSDVLVSLSLNEIGEVSASLVDRKNEQREDFEYLEKTNRTLGELRKMSVEINKESDFTVSNDIVKELLTIFNEKNILDSEIKLLNRMRDEVNLSSTLENKTRIMPKMRP